MQKKLVLTLTGSDRIGLVEQVTKLVLECDGNVESSRMARLGGEFAMLMLISIPDQKLVKLSGVIEILLGQGFTVTSCQTEVSDPNQFSGWLPFQVEVHGADHEGIIHNIAQYLAAHQVNIETMDTNMVKAPMSGTPLFLMNAIVLVPPDLSFHAIQDELEMVGDNLNVDIHFKPYTGQ